MDTIELRRFGDALRRGACRCALVGAQVAPFSVSSPIARSGVVPHLQCSEALSGVRHSPLDPVQCLYWCHWMGNFAEPEPRARHPTSIIARFAGTANLRSHGVDGAGCADADFAP